MEFQILYNQEIGVIEARVSSIFNLNLIDNMAPELAKKAVNTGCKLMLIDFSKTEISMKTVEIFKVPEKLAQIFNSYGLDIRCIKRSILFSKQNEDFQFLETVSDNSGHNFKIFTDEKDAMIWLTTDRNQN